MASRIQIKRGSGTSVPSSLSDGELAINLDNGKLYFGSGSTVVNSFRFENLTAENYIVSSSVTNITTQELSGSTVFGDSSDDTHAFVGVVSGSTAISASHFVAGQNSSFGILEAPIGANRSGPVTAIIGDGHTNGFGVLFGNNAFKTQILGSSLVFGTQQQHVTMSINSNLSGSAAGTIQAGSGSYHILQGDTSQNTALYIEGSITSSGDISSSAHVYANGITIPDSQRSYAGPAFFTGTATGHEFSANVSAASLSGGTLNISGPAGGHITASGNISSSATITAEHFYSSDDIVALGEISSSATITAEHILSSDDIVAQGEISSSGTINGQVGLTLYTTGSHTSVGTTAQGEIIKFGNSSTTAGEIYQMKNDGTWAEARANAAATSTGSLAVAMDDNSNKGMLLRGMVRLVSDPGGSLGQPLYLSDVTSGRATATLPSSNNDVARVVGYQISGSGTIYFNPDNTWVVVTA